MKAVDQVSCSHPLGALRVCILGASDFATDARVRKQAAALRESGAHVSIVGIGEAPASDLGAYDVHMLPPTRGKIPRLGREEVWWPLRVAVNLTYTKTLQWWLVGRSASPILAEEDALVERLRRLDPDVIHAYNIRTLPAAVRLKCATGARVVYDCRDLYTDVEYIDERTRQRYRKAEAQLIHEADGVLTVSEPFADILSARHKIRRPLVIYNGPAQIMSSVSPVRHPVRLFFQGAYRPNRNLSALIEAMTELRDRATLTLQGFGDLEGGLRSQVATQGLDDVVSFLPPVAPLDVVQSAAAFDVGIICYRGDTLNLQATAPYKLMDYLGAGLAVASSDLPGPRSVLDGTGAGFYIDPTSAGTIARDLGELLANPERINKMKHAALHAAPRFGWPAQRRQFLEVYELLGPLRVAGRV